MSQTPAFTLPVNTLGVATISAANTNRDGTGTIVTVYTAGPAGSRIAMIEIVATGTTTTGVVRLFLSNGTTTWLWAEHLVTAVSPTASGAVWSKQIVPVVPAVLPSGWSVRASTHNAETFVVIVHGGNF